MIDARMLEDYYRNTLGEPSRLAEFSAAGHRVDVLKWDPSEKASDAFLYVTRGLSIEGYVPPDVKHRAELFVGLLPAEDEIARALAGAAFELIARQATPQHGLAITFAEPLWNGSLFTGFVVTVPRVEILPSVRIGEDHVQFYQVIPVTKQESSEIKREGYEHLRAAWERRSVPFWDPRRPSSI